jgi:hypothetical protein
MGRGKEKKIKDGSATADQVEMGEMSETKAFANRKQYITYFIIKSLCPMECLINGPIPFFDLKQV